MKMKSSALQVVAKVAKFGALSVGFVVIGSYAVSALAYGNLYPPNWFEQEAYRQGLRQTIMSFADKNGDSMLGLPELDDVYRRAGIDYKIDFHPQEIRGIANKQIMLPKLNMEQLERIVESYKTDRK